MKSLRWWIMKNCGIFFENFYKIVRFADTIIIHSSSFIFHYSFIFLQQPQSDKFQFWLSVVMKWPLSRGNISQVTDLQTVNSAEGIWEESGDRFPAYSHSVIRGLVTTRLMTSPWALRSKVEDWIPHSENTDSWMQPFLTPLRCPQMEYEIVCF